MPCWAQDGAATEPSTVPGGEASTTSDAPPETTSPSVEVETFTNPLCYNLNEALAKIALDKGDALCRLNSACNGLVCNFTVFSMKVWVLPCADPPVVRMAIIDNQGEKLFDDAMMETATIQGQNYSIEVVFDLQEGGFGLQVYPYSLADWL